MQKGILFSLLVIFFLSFGLQAQDHKLGNEESDYSFATLYTWQFIQDINWPADYRKKRFKIYVLGPGEIYKYLKAWENHKKIKGHKVEVTQVGNLDDMERPNVIVVPFNQSHLISHVAWKFKGKPSLIISEKHGMIQKGSHLNLIKVKKRIRFESGSGSITGNGLKMEEALKTAAYKDFPDKVEIKEPSKKFKEIKEKDLIDNRLSAKERDALFNFMDEMELLAATDTRKNVKIDAEEYKALLENQQDQAAQAKISEEEMARQKQQMAKQRKEIEAISEEMQAKQAEMEERNREIEMKKLEMELLKVEEEKINRVLTRKEKILKGKELTIKEQLGEIQSHKSIIYVMAIFLTIALILAYFIFRNYRAKVQANKVIEEQKALVEEKNQKITDSINYAKRLQSAILPSSKIVKGYLDESFIYYQPKDIVAGDFYWMEESGNKTIFAAADCTGHGVPGAFVSIVCNNALNRSVREYKQEMPSKILDLTRDLVVAQFSSNEDNVKDGMDISLCAFDLKKRKLEFAGAHNKLFIVRKGKEGPELEEIKGDKQPIGVFDEPQPFTNHSIQLSKGDCIYLTTDGFPDQFGGPKGKKFMNKRFKELLVTLFPHPMDQQKQMLKRAFEDWRGNEEQLDDVCVIGMRA